jgi:hypothetical protein
MSNFPAQWGSRTTQLFDEGQSRSAFVPFQADQRPKPPLQSGLLVRNLKRANPTDNPINNAEAKALASLRLFSGREP